MICSVPCGKTNWSRQKKTQNNQKTTPPRKNPLCFTFSAVAKEARRVPFGSPLLWGRGSASPPRPPRGGRRFGRANAAGEDAAPPGTCRLKRRRGRNAGFHPPSASTRGSPSSPGGRCGSGRGFPGPRSSRDRLPSGLVAADEARGLPRGVGAVFAGGRGPALAAAHLAEPVFEGAGRPRLASRLDGFEVCSAGVAGEGGLFPKPVRVPTGAALKYEMQGCGGGYNSRLSTEASHAFSRTVTAGDGASA